MSWLLLLLLAGWVRAGVVPATKEQTKAGDQKAL